MSTLTREDYEGNRGKTPPKGKIRIRIPDGNTVPVDRRSSIKQPTKKGGSKKYLPKTANKNILIGGKT